MTETKKTKEEAQQWLVTMTCLCPGHPAIHNKEGRVKCSARIEVPHNEYLSYRKQQHANNAFLQERGWKRLKTLGVQRRLCHSCSEMVLRQRKKNRARGGA